MAAELDLKLLTLNCWGLWVVSKHRKVEQISMTRRDMQYSFQVTSNALKQ